MGDAIIVIDANVIKDIARGNTNAAVALLRYMRSKARVYIARVAYQQVVINAPTPELRAAYRHLLSELNIEVPPSFPLQDRARFYAHNVNYDPANPRAGESNPPTNPRPGQITQHAGRDVHPVYGKGDLNRPSDMYVAAEVNSIPNAKLWTLDQRFAKQARNLGIKMAPESFSISGVSGPEDPFKAMNLLGIEPEVATPATWRPTINIGARTVGFGGGFRAVAATFGEFALTAGLAIAFTFAKRWMMNKTVKDKYNDGWKAVGREIDVQIAKLRPDIAKLQLKLGKEEKVFANVIVKVTWVKHSISSHMQRTDWEEPDIVLADISLATKSVGERAKSYEVHGQKIEEFTRGFEVQVFADDELEEFRRLSAAYLERKRQLGADPSNAKLMDEVRKLREQVVHTYGPNVWYLEREKLTD
jgi:predicted nucleic acid-binding protein